MSTVEHLLAALEAHRIEDGLQIQVEGPELPLLDGGAGAWVRALAGLGLEPAEAALAVVRDGEVNIGSSHFAFRRAEGVSITVQLDFGDDRLAAEAVWLGDAGDFDRRIAPARTFAFEREVEEIGRAGLVRHVDPSSVVLVAESIHFSGLAFGSDEPARHKLLDLMGDAYLHGGVPRGVVVARRPGHSVNHTAFEKAIELGILARERRA